MAAVVAATATGDAANIYNDTRVKREACQRPQMLQMLRVAIHKQPQWSSGLQPPVCYVSGAWQARELWHQWDSFSIAFATVSPLGVGLLNGLPTAGFWTIFIASGPQLLSLCNAILLSTFSGHGVEISADRNWLGPLVTCRISTHVQNLTVLNYHWIFAFSKLTCYLI